MTKLIKLMLPAVLLFPVATFATQVELYGILDEAILVQKAKGEPAHPDLTSGYSQGNRIGIRGTEDLGNGYSVSFALEQGFNIDTGTQFNTWSNNGVVQNGAFNRQSYLAVSGPFGKVSFGRWAVLTSGTGDFNFINLSPFGIGYLIGSYTSYMINYGRVNNGVSWITPNYSGLQFSLMYSNGVTTDTEQWSLNNHYYGIGARYKNKDLDFSVIYEAEDYKSTNHNLLYSITAGGSYDFKVTKLFAGYQFAHQRNTKQQHVAILSTATPLFSGTLKFGGKILLGQLKGDAVATHTQKDYDSWNLDIAYEYPLSKRTYVYGFGGYAHGWKLLGTAESISSSGLGFTAAYVNGWALAIGMNHKF